MIDIYNPPNIDISGMHRAMDKRAGRLDAEGVFSHLQNRIRAFQNEMSKDNEIAIQLANFGIAAEIHIRSIGFQNPNLIEFVGLLADGREVHLVQHISQLNFLLVAVPPIALDQEPYRVGF